MNDWTGFADAFRVGGWVIYPLTVLAITALAIVADRAYIFWRFGRMPNGATAGQAHGIDGGSMANVFPQEHALSRLGRILDDHGDAPLWRTEARIEAAASQIERDMSRGLWLLETIVTAAPLIGLLGTIVGMMRSFRLIGGDGLVSPAGVSGGVAQALVATAIGLIIALVSLFSFNYFSRRVDRLMDELESHANERLGNIRLALEERGARS